MATPLSKAVNLGKAIARDGVRYPALRVKPLTEREPAAALEALGFGADELGDLERQYERVAAEVFPQLLERARNVGADVPVSKLARPDHPAHAGKKLLYLAVRLLRPETVVETGTFNGTLSTFLLLGLRDNGRGRLVSLDLPAYAPIEHATDHPLPTGHEPGWLIPDDLRLRFELVLGDARRALPQALARLGTIDLFFHDSLHTTRHMLFEYRRAWSSLRPGGLLVSDDVFMTPAFWWFTRTRRLPFVHIGSMGVVRKR